MLYRSSIAAIALAAVLGATSADAQVREDAKYPDLSGQWVRGYPGGARFDPAKGLGPRQEAPLTPEYQAIYQADLAEQAAGGQGIDPTYRCLSPGMPRIMHVYSPMEIVVTPKTTYILIEHIHDNRRIHTDGRDFPADMYEDPQFAGYSIGKWVDEDGDGRYDTLVVETRGLKNPRTYDASGIPFHADGRTIIRERIYLDKADQNTLYDDITVIDNALTRPWSAHKTYRRAAAKGPIWWREDICAENNAHVVIGGEDYFLSADGLLMPTKKDQAAPDLRFFKQKGK
ncbi:MAG TPA: hypothetical protein VGP86_02390 [Xanthobacteraceae bacterium]|jgi:hypothetical protein|nr:hypothetical protein [Xanthobacteraceae bacterium]